MLTDLPLEIQIKLIQMVPDSNLKYTSPHFYLLYNDLFYHKFIHDFGEESLIVILKVIPWLVPYIKSLDSFRLMNRTIISNRLNLQLTSPTNPFNVQFIKDSWKYIYSIFKNKRLFAEYQDYRIDEPSNYIFNHYVEINRTYLLSYKKTVWLSPGKYNLNTGLAVKYGHGLGTTKFEIKYDNEKINFYPPTNINDILPKNQFCFLKIGEFEITRGKNDENSTQKLKKIEITMEEIGLYIKSGFRIYFIDISQPSLLFNEYDLLFYTLKETNYIYFINIFLKNLYKAINFVQNGGCPDNSSYSCAPKRYGYGNPFDLFKEYEKSYLKDSTSTEANQLFEYDDDKLKEYSNLYYNTKFKRYFKFTTIYQQRQFINRYGDYQIDWNTDDEVVNADDDSKRCEYDKEGLKWKIPIIGEL
ncbi:unnamed protein product [Candida verbasci]|uniref:Uncharacterized protein n=1 Tax=Candida verbasci TaxID=1227364 RepID=A0A9W4TYG7_9ASCO|nr:unnamed protein product [Candida verbasci]